MTFPFARPGPKFLTRVAFIAVCWALLAPATGMAQPNADKLPVIPPAAPEPRPAANTLSLGECLAIALERRPMIRAAIHSQAASQRGYEALFKLPRVAELVSPDLPVRKQQAAHGLTLSAAEIEKARRETINDVTFLYYSAVYARQQEITANDVNEQLIIYRGIMEEIIKQGIRDPKVKVDTYTLHNLVNKIGDVELLQLKARIGRRRALEALKEAMGVDGTFDFVPRDTELPVMGGTVTQDQVIGLAMATRPELAQASAGVQAFRLEVAAQNRLRTIGQANTLAAGSDLHSKLFPSPHRNGEYRPGAVPPEMPASLVGRREDRVARACELAARQDAVYDAAVALIRLEAANAYLEWEEASLRMKESKRRFEASRKVLEDTKAVALARQDAQMLVQYEAEAGRAQADYVEAVLEHIKSLAKLERVTSGGIRPDFPGR